MQVIFMYLYGARIKLLDISLISLYCLFPGAVSEAQPNDNEYITKLCHDMFAKTADYLNGEFESNGCFLSGYLFSFLFVWHGGQLNQRLSCGASSDLTDCG